MKKRKFIQIYDDIAFAQDLSDIAIRVYLALKSFCYNKSQCYPSLNQLANKINKSAKTVERALKNLEESGYITIVQRKDEEQKQMSNLYILNDSYDYGNVYTTETRQCSSITNSDSQICPTDLLNSNSQICPTDLLNSDRQLCPTNNIYTTVDINNTEKTNINNISTSTYTLTDEVDVDKIKAVISSLYDEYDSQYHSVIDFLNKYVILILNQKDDYLFKDLGSSKTAVLAKDLKTKICAYSKSDYKYVVNNIYKSVMSGHPRGKSDYGYVVELLFNGPQPIDNIVTKNKKVVSYGDFLRRTDYQFNDLEKILLSQN